MSESGRKVEWNREMEETIPFKNLHSREYQGHKKKVFFKNFTTLHLLFFFVIKKLTNPSSLFFGIKGTFGGLEL